MKRRPFIAPFFALFVSQSTLFAISDPQNARLCSESNCKYIPPLSPPKPINMTIQMESRTALLSVIKEIKEVSLVRVSRQSSFCYVSMFLSDRGEECAMRNQHVVLDRDEVLDTVNKGMCRVGKDCSRPDEDSECRQLSFYGGPCRDQTRNNLMKPQQPRNCEKQMTPMIHVCTLCWACQIEQYPYVPKLVSEAGEVTMLLGLPGQKEIKLGIHEIGEVKELENGWYLHTSKAEMRESFVDVGCLKEGSKSLCLTKTDGLGLPAGSVFEVSKIGEGSLNNYHIAIEGPFVGSEETHNGKINSAATQADLINEVQSLQFESRQSRYNAMAISKTITELQGLINNMINSLTKTNPMLLGEIIGRPIVTSWEGEQTIRICGCARPNPIPNKSECFGRYYFEQGSWMYRPQGGECQSRSRQVGKSLNLFSMANISIEGMAYPTLHEVVEEIHQNDKGEVQDDGAFPKDQGASSDKPFIVVYIFSKLVEVVKSASPWMSLISILLWLNLILSRLRRQI